MVGNQRQGWAILGVMGVLFIAGVAVTYWAEASGTTAMHALGLTGGNMEGKEVRFGIVASAVRRGHHRRFLRRRQRHA
jgi:K+-transporting ATPase ATPase A chain